MKITAAQFTDYVLPATEEYAQAEIALSKAWAEKNGDDDADLVRVQKHAIRKASEVAVALSSLVDRAAVELTITKGSVWKEIQSDCLWEDNGPMREGAAGRVRSVGDAYKHHTLDPARHLVRSADDILACGLSYGADAWGVGKFSGIEVMSRESGSGLRWKFLGDVHVVLRSWKLFLERRNVDLTGINLPL